jgi:murein DD-endopeptidase MepM/ murein hydrolase activator NlpD
MRKLALLPVILITAIVTAILTSLFWIAAYNLGAQASPRAEGAGPAPAPGASAVTRPIANNAPVLVAPSGLAIPVAGIRPGQLSDTFTQARAGGARVHDAIDIMAPRGTPVIAAAEGTVEKLYFSQGGGGISVYVRSPDRLWTFYYAHLDAYAAGLHEGQQVRRGDLLGTVGSTGNASPDGPHLHFAVHSVTPAERWHQGRAINPYPLLAGTGAPR